MNKNFYLKIIFLVVLLTHGIEKVSSQNVKFGFEIEEDRNTTVIPFELIGNLIVVDILFEGFLPLKFIVDSGVTNTVLIDKTYTDILNITPNRKITLVGAAGTKEVEAYIVNRTNIKVNKVTGSNIPLLILEKDYLDLQKNLGITVHGILGYDFFKNFIFQIDYRTQVIKLYKPEKFRRPLFFYSEIPLHIENSKPYIFQNMKVEEDKEILIKLMIDTGASHSLMLHKNSSDYIALPEKNIRTTLGAGIAGEIIGNTARIQQLKIDKHILTGVITNYPDSGVYNEIIENTGRNGTLGGGLLQKFKVIFDYNNGSLYIRKNLNFREKFKYDMSGLTIIAKGEYYLEPYYEIDKVRKNTPAYEAGLKEKDKVISLNGTFASELNMNYINNQLSKKEGKKIRMYVKRGDKILNFTFLLKEFI